MEVSAKRGVLLLSVHAFVSAGPFGGPEEGLIIDGQVVEIDNKFISGFGSA